MFLLYDTYSPIIKWRTSAKKSFERQMAFKTVDFIQSDWQSEKNAASISEGKCDIYISNQKPSVQREICQIGYWAGGEGFLPYFNSLGFTPDYIATQKDKLESTKYELVQRYDLKNRSWFIWKRRHSETKR